VKLTHPFVLALCTCTAAAPLVATAQAPAAAAPSIWNQADEISISGSIASILSTYTPNAPGGSSLLITSSQGDLYVNLGPHPGAPLTRQLTEGQLVTLTGIVSSSNGQSYLLARTLNINGQTYLLRSANGMPHNNVSSATQSARTGQGTFGGAR